MQMSDHYFNPIETYKSAKKRQFEKTTNRIKMILEGIKQLSLNETDKKKLLNKVKEIVSDF